MSTVGQVTLAETGAALMIAVQETSAAVRAATVAAASDDALMVSS
jgi:hypothetical protein